MKKQTKKKVREGWGCAERCEFVALKGGTLNYLEKHGLLVILKSHEFRKKPVSTVAHSLQN
jgi:hypothetical protein